jgi:hypothetical protein
MLHCEFLDLPVGGHCCREGGEVEEGEMYDEKVEKVKGMNAGSGRCDVKGKMELGRWKSQFGFPIVRGRSSTRSSRSTYAVIRDASTAAPRSSQKMTILKISTLRRSRGVSCFA